MSAPTRRRFGQHFLAPAWAERVVEAIAPEIGDVFLEIGPGKGALTLPLAETGAPIIAIEIDRVLSAALARRAPPNVTIVTGDVLETDVRPLVSGLAPQRPADAAGSSDVRRRFRVVGNLPYYIASPILFRLIDIYRAHGFFADATVMLQREVADRILASPRTKDYGVLTILLAMHARTSRLLDLPPGAFRPPPKVRSSVVRLAFGPAAARVRDEALFERLVKAMFSHRRKTIANALKSFDAAAAAILAEAAIDPSRRPETLQLAEIARLAELFTARRSGPPVL